MEEEIKHYLASEDPDYQDGLRLLGKYNRNRNLAQQLGRKESPAHIAKLRYELYKLAGDTTLATLPLPLQAGATPEVATPTDAAPEQEEAPGPDLAELMSVLTPEALAEVEDLTRLMSTVYSQKVAASNSLGDCTSRADRQRVVDDIQLRENEYNALAEKKRLVIERGTATPPEAEKPQPTLAELLKDRSNLRSNLSKATKKSKESRTPEKRAEYEQKAGKLAVELEELELTIKKLQEK